MNRDVGVSETIVSALFYIYAAKVLIFSPSAKNAGYF